jgi:hypothetical protein
MLRHHAAAAAIQPVSLYACCKLAVLLLWCRFMLTAVCGGDTTQILLAVSSTSSALGSWILYSCAGEVTQSTDMAGDGYPSALHTQISYNAGTF